ncbi:DivIVA domain-containing protein [Deinococcus koreensis]|uniref:Cell division protein DivIVA n=1 Tax=Deinococcus koreensis TaxID=2054903 RepID=A0A2K3V0N6_9DEIO|nr:DivIVA domain-containing protein [Deinococcus koreensis]PNY82343.1 cell division protein DivIVA [Deinococcus koreensis]
MKFTPLDIRHQEFPQRLGSYQRASVRAYLSDLAEEVEVLLQRQQEQQEYLLALEKQLDERKQHEDEIRRAVIAAERIGHEVRENAVRESQLLISQATTEHEGVMRDAESRRSELEARHQARMSALEASFRTRFAELERQLHDLTLERDRVQAQRLMELEREFNERHVELSGRLAASRLEYAQFLSTYRALMTSFSEMSARHSLPDDLALAAPRLPQHELLPPLQMGSIEAAGAPTPSGSSATVTPPEAPHHAPHDAEAQAQITSTSS